MEHVYVCWDGDSLKKPAVDVEVSYERFILKISLNLQENLQLSPIISKVTRQRVQLYFTRLRLQLY